MLKYVLDPNHLPEHLYKFRVFGDPNHKRILTHNELFFPSPRQFNDPFDGTIPARYDGDAGLVSRLHYSQITDYVPKTLRLSKRGIQNANCGIQSLNKKGMAQGQSSRLMSQKGNQLGEALESGLGFGISKVQGIHKKVAVFKCGLSIANLKSEI